MVRDHEIWELGMRENAGGAGAHNVEFYSVAGAMRVEEVEVCYRRRRLRLGVSWLGCGDISTTAAGFGLPTLNF
jgi:hypothetical protein